MKIRDVQGLNYGELQRWWEVDCDVLVTTAVAEASGPVHPSVAEALRSREWIEQWADALNAGSGELQSTVERMAFTRDSRLSGVTKRDGLVHQRLGQANRLLKAAEMEHGRGMLCPSVLVPLSDRVHQGRSAG